MEILINTIIFFLPVEYNVKYFGHNPNNYKQFLNEHTKNQVLFFANKFNNYPLILKCLSMNTRRSYDYNWIMKKASQFNYFSTIKEMISLGARK